MRLVFWGTYDTGKPRTRILLRGLREIGVEVIECRRDIWSEIEDKSRITSRRHQLLHLLRLLASYPGLIWRYLRLPDHDAVVVGYPAQLDALILWPLARLRGKPLVLDLVQSAYISVVAIRRMLNPRQLAARLLFSAERLALKGADRAVFLSRFGADDFARRFGLDRKHTGAVMIGVEPEHFPALRVSRPMPDPAERAVEVLFYGSFHKLHGIDSIVEAARLGRDLPIHWTLIGRGQEEERIRRRLAEAPLDKLTWLPWVPYTELVEWLHRSDIALGLLGRPGETGWAIPNKLFQIITAGVPLITADTPAVRELVGTPRPDLMLIPPGDATALLAAVQAMATSPATTVPHPGRRHADLVQRLQPEAIARGFVDQVEAAIELHLKPGTTQC